MLDLIQTRRDLHQIPEIGLEEFKTHAYLLSIIETLTAGKDFVQIRTWRTGILVYLQGSQPEGTIGWRTDIDGLPIVEQTGLPFVSQHHQVVALLAIISAVLFQTLALNIKSASLVLPIIL